MKSFPYFTGDETSDRFLYNEARPQRGGEGGPLKVEDIEDLNDVDRSEAELAEVQAALTKANSILDGEPHDLTIKALKKIDADGRFTMADVAELDTFAPRIKTKLEEIRAKRAKEEGIDATGDSGMGLGLGLAEVEEEPRDDLGLGLATVADGDDLGLGLATTDAAMVTGNAGNDDLGLGLAETETPADEDVAETVPFEPNEDRCRDCANRVVEDFATYSAEAQQDVVVSLVRMETFGRCSIDDIDEAQVKRNCDTVLARYEKATTDEALADANEQATQTEEIIEAAAQEETDAEIAREASADAKSETTQAEIKEHLDNLGDQLTLSQIEAALAKCNQLEDKNAYSEIRAALTTVKSDLNRVASIAPPDNPQEAAVLQQIVASTPVSWKAPSPAVRYQAIIAAIDAGQLSDDTRRRAKEALVGVRAHNPSIQTGGDVNDVLRNGYGEETYIDENGEVQTRKVPLQPGQEIPVTDNAALTVSDNGQPQLKISTSTGEFHADLSENVTADIMTQTVLTTQLIAQFHDINLAEVMYGRPMQERGGGRIDLRLPEDFNRTKRLMQTLYGGTAGYNGEILQQGDLDRIPYLMQFHSSKGDAMRGDVNPDMMRADLEAQGVIENGSINWQRFENMVMANRANMYTAPKDFAQTEKAA